MLTAEARQRKASAGVTESGDEEELDGENLASISAMTMSGFSHGRSLAEVTDFFEKSK